MFDLKNQTLTIYNILNCNKKRNWYILGVELHSPLNPRNKSLKQFSQLHSSSERIFKENVLRSQWKKVMKNRLFYTVLCKYYSFIVHHPWL